MMRLRLNQPYFTMDVKIEQSWKNALAHEFAQPYFEQIKAGLLACKNAGKTFYPRGSLIFNAFDTTPLPESLGRILTGTPCLTCKLSG